MNENENVNYHEVVDQNEFVEKRQNDIKNINNTAKQINNIAKDLDFQIDRRDSNLDLITRDQKKMDNNALNTRNEAIKTEKITSNKRGCLKWLFISIFLLIIIIIILILTLKK